MKPRIRQSVSRMQGYVPGEQPEDPRVVKLNTNENPYPPSACVLEAARTFDPALLRRYPPPDSRALKEQIAALHGCAPEQVFVGNGSDEVLALCTRAFVEDDGSIGYLDPSYSLYPVLANIRDVDTVPVALAPDFGWPLDEGIPDAVRACSLFFVTNPNAPTGILVPRRCIEAFCRVFDGVVVVDEAYVDFSSEHCMDLALTLDNVLVARSLSKSYSLAGLRLGYAVGPVDLIGALARIKDSYNIDRFTQEIALAALSDVGSMQANVAKVQATRARLIAGLEALGYEVAPSETNFVWARPGGLPARTVFERLREQGIYIRYFDGPRTADFVRITVGTDTEIDKLLAALGTLHAEH